MVRSEKEIRQELFEAEAYAAQVRDRLERVQGVIDDLRRELIDNEGADNRRPMGVR